MGNWVRLTPVDSAISKNAEVGAGDVMSVITDIERIGADDVIGRHSASMMKMARGAMVGEKSDLMRH